jgi:hypothetical protein
MEQAGRFLLLGGLVMAAFGGLALLLAKVAPNFRPGRLPGDIAIERPGFSLFIPITTMILFSALLTLILWGISASRR